jgi:uncharacterized protein
MQTIQQRIAAADWLQVAEDMHGKGFSLLRNMIPATDCAQLQQTYVAAGAYRKTVDMGRYRFGAGTYKYFNYPLPDLIQGLRTQVYPYLALIANDWMQALQLQLRFPLQHEALLDRCRQLGQDKATVLILKYTAGGYNTLHQDIYGDAWFPLQMVLFLNEAGKDYTGGEFVLTEQIPRAQSKAIVLQPAQGDILVFTTNFRPVKGNRGYYRVNMKHGISEVRSGERYSLGIIFHDAGT